MQVKNRRKVQPSRNAASANENGERLNIADCSTRSLRAAHRGTVPSGREGATAPAQERVYPDSAAAGEELLRCAVPRQDRAIAVFREMASVRRRTAEIQLKNRSDAIARRCRAVIQRLGHPNGSIVTHGRCADLGQQHGHSVDDLQEFLRSWTCTSLRRQASPTTCAVWCQCWFCRNAGPRRANAAWTIHNIDVDEVSNDLREFSSNGQR
ncbi:hypothetical protein KL929_004508 [Ogataea haglerorum]|nr:hypothetical protein KL929_004508 [Ogataea haglerorum]